MSSLLDDFNLLFKRRFRYRFEGEIVACNLCGGTEYDVVGCRDRYFGPLQTVLCRGCGLVYTNPMPTEAEVSASYARHYRKNYHGAEEPRVRAAARASAGAVERLAQLAPYLPAGARVLDVGSGGGEFVACLSENGYRATGLEPNRGYAEFSRREYGIDARNADWQNAKFDAGSLDMITASHVLEHFRDKRLRAYFDRQTAWNYYRTATPYKRFFHKLAKRVNEYRNVRDLESPRDAVDRAFKETGKQPLP